MKALTSILAPLALLTSLTFMACGSESGTPAPQTAIPEAHPDPCKGAVVVTTDSLGNILNAEVKCTDACDGACTVRVKADDQGNTRSWCACDNREPTECHIVLYKPANGAPRWFCPTAENCTISKDIEMVDGNTVTTYRCVD